MERLMLLQLQADGCGAEASCNGVPVVRLAPGQRAATVAVHEYAFSGQNRFVLTLAPQTPGAAPPPVAPAQPAAHAMAASLHLLLPRVGAPADPQRARTLAQLDVAVAAGETATLPLSKTLDVTLPINFPRWRWADAPLVDATPAVLQQVLAFIAALAQDLARGQTAGFIAATRLRTEELAVAYQRQPAAETARLQAWLQHLHAAGKLLFAPLDAASLRLRPVADGRLLDCVAASDGGAAALRTLPDAADGSVVAFALRLAIADGRIHVLR